MPFSISVPRLMIKIIAARGDFNKVADRWARAETRSNTELAAALRSNAEHRFTPPGFGPGAPLTDIVTHSQDICRPLGIARDVPADHAKVVLELLVSPKATRGFVSKGLTDGLGFATTDTGWTYGSGEEVTGTAGDLIMTIGGRHSAIDALSGTGVATLRSRLGT